jgi:hypothetical protein
VTSPFYEWKILRNGYYCANIAVNWKKFLALLKKVNL